MEKNVKQNTIVDIARDTGFSVATVSRALNNSPKVTEATKRRVLESARNLNYTPNEPAKMLVRGSSHTIGLLLPDNSAVNHIIYSAINLEFMKRKLEVILFNANNNLSVEDFLMHELVKRRVMGIVVLPLPGEYKMFDYAMSSGIPLVVLGRFVAAYNVSHVLFDFRKGISEAVDHLVRERGKRNFVQLALKDVADGLERRKAFEFALRANQIIPDHTLVHAVEDTCESGYTVMRGLLERGEIIDAVLCSSDYTAAGALRAIADRGLSAPNDIAVVGFHNMDISQYYTPRISTIAVDIEEFARLVADTMIGLIEDKFEMKNTGVSTTFLHKETT
ncbi:MAG: LacI family DNA-binding transcriptional regulator [Spirochaetes bacterium]|nr:LacI family DNA-binding transcriptional regulator [Spirochaetota bacterium]